MAPTQEMCNSFKMELFQGIHSTAHTYKLALYNSSATINKGTTAYSTVNEISSGAGNGYTAGGVTLTSCTANTSGDIAYLDFADPTWSTGTFTARGALIYNTNGGLNKAVCVLDFSTDYTCSNGAFTITLPAPGAAAIIRIT
jgi:hypothetical protein